MKRIICVFICLLAFVSFSYGAKLTKEEEAEIRRQAELLVRSQMEIQLETERLTEDLRWFYRIGNYKKAREVLDELLRFSPKNKTALKYKNLLSKTIKEEKRLSESQIKEEERKRNLRLQEAENAETKLWHQAKKELLERAKDFSRKNPGSDAKKDMLDNAKEFFREDPGSLAKEDMLAAAKGKARSLVDNANDTVKELMTQGNRHVQNREFAKAEEKYKEVLKVKKDSWQAKDNLKKAEKQGKEYEAYKKKWVGKYLKAGEDYIKDKRFEDAHRVLKEALKLEPEHMQVKTMIENKVEPNIRLSEKLGAEIKEIQALMIERKFDQAFKRARELYFNGYPYSRKAEKVWMEARRRKQVAEVESAAKEKVHEVAKRMKEVVEMYKPPESVEYEDTKEFELPEDIKKDLAKTEKIKNILEEKKVTVSFDGARLVDALNTLSTIVDVDIIPYSVPSDEEVIFKVSDMPFGSALTYLLEPKGLTYTIAPDALLVGTKEKLDKAKTNIKTILYNVKFIPFGSRLGGGKEEESSEDDEEAPWGD
jgi:tetratricopeptide (TPR) repeat protein